MNSKHKIIIIITFQIKEAEVCLEILTTQMVILWIFLHFLEDYLFCTCQYSVLIQQYFRIFTVPGYEVSSTSVTLFSFSLLPWLSLPLSSLPIYLCSPTVPFCYLLLSSDAFVVCTDSPLVVGCTLSLTHKHECVLLLTLWSKQLESVQRYHDLLNNYSGYLLST